MRLMSTAEGAAQHAAAEAPALRQTPGPIAEGHARRSAQQEMTAMQMRIAPRARAQATCAKQVQANATLTRAAESLPALTSAGLGWNAEAMQTAYPATATQIH